MKKFNISFKKIICASLIVMLLITIIIINEIIISKKKSNYDESNIDFNIEDNNAYGGITEESSFPNDVYGIKVYTQFIESNSISRWGIKRKIKYIVLHETDNFYKNTGAKNHANYLSYTNKTSTSWHYTVDDSEIYHHIPDNEVAFHASNRTGNLFGIGIELCVNKDGNYEKTFENATKLVAYLLNEYDLSIEDIKTHSDFTNKNCPHNILVNGRLDEFKQKVDYIMKNENVQRR